MTDLLSPIMLTVAGVLTIFSLQVPALLIPAAFILGFGLRVAITRAQR